MKICELSDNKVRINSYQRCDNYLSASCKIALNDIDIAGLHPLRVDYDNKINVTNCKRITSVVNFLIMHLRVF